MWYASPFWPTWRQRISLAFFVGLELLAGGDQVLDGLRRLGGQLGVADQREVLHRVRHAVELAVEGDGLDRGLVEARPSARRSSCTGSMAPFCTRLPIQSCAPTTTSGPLPCWEAVTKLVCRSLETAWTSTVTPFSWPNFSANGLRAAVALVVGPDHQLAAGRPWGCRRRPARRCRRHSRRRRAPGRGAATTPAVRMRIGTPVVMAGRRGKGGPPVETSGSSCQPAHGCCAAARRMLRGR